MFLKFFLFYFNDESRGCHGSKISDPIRNRPMENLPEPDMHKLILKTDPKGMQEKLDVR